MTSDFCLLRMAEVRGLREWLAGVRAFPHLKIEMWGTRRDGVTSAGLKPGSFCNRYRPG